MQEPDEAKPLLHAMHLDVSVAREHVRVRREAALAAGGRIVDESHAPSHWTLADRAGNRVCICAWPDGAILSPLRSRRRRGGVSAGAPIGLGDDLQIMAARIVPVHAAAAVVPIDLVRP